MIYACHDIVVCPRAQCAPYACLVVAVAVIILRAQLGDMVGGITKLRFKDLELDFGRELKEASVARKKRSVLRGLGPFRDNMCTWLTALTVLRYAPDYGDFSER